MDGSARPTALCLTCDCCCSRSPSSPFVCDWSRPDVLCKSLLGRGGRRMSERRRCRNVSLHAGSLFPLVSTTHPIFPSVSSDRKPAVVPPRPPGQTCTEYTAVYKLRAVLTLGLRGCPFGPVIDKRSFHGMHGHGEQDPNPCWVASA